MRNGLDSATASDCPKRLCWRLFCFCFLWFARDSATAKKRVKQCAVFFSGSHLGGCKVASVTSKDSVRV